MTTVQTSIDNAKIDRQNASESKVFNYDNEKIGEMKKRNKTNINFTK